MTATDTNDTPPLGHYAGRPVAKATIEIRGTGSGLEKGLHLPPMILEPGETYDVVLRCVADKHRHDLDDETGSFTLVNMLRAETATIADADDLVGKALDDAESRVAERKAAEEEQRRRERGEEPLPFDDADDVESVGEVIEGSGLDDAIALAQEAEDVAEWRRERTAELDRFDKDGVAALARSYGIAPGSKTKSELVDAICDHEEAAR